MIPCALLTTPDATGRHLRHMLRATDAVIIASLVTRPLTDLIPAIVAEQRSPWTLVRLGPSGTTPLNLLDRPDLSPAKLATLFGGSYRWCDPDMQSFLSATIAIVRLTKGREPTLLDVVAYALAPERLADAFLPAPQHRELAALADWHAEWQRDADRAAICAYVLEECAPFPAEPIRRPFWPQVGPGVLPRHREAEHADRLSPGRRSPPDRRPGRRAHRPSRRACGREGPVRPAGSSAGARVTTQP